MAGNGHFRSLFGSTPPLIALVCTFTCKSASDIPASPQESPLSALQQLSLAHKKSARSTKLSLLALAPSRVSDRNSIRDNTQALPLNSSARSNLNLPNLDRNTQRLSVPADQPPNPTAPSKLSLLAKAKASQSLSTSTPSIPSALSFAPPSTNSTVSQKGSMPSKIALKIQKARDKSTSDQTPVPMIVQPPVEDLSLFRSFSSRIQAAPSPFARILLPRLNVFEAVTSVTKPQKLPTSPFYNSDSSFTFNGPSPDDIVLSARRSSMPGSRTSRT